MHRKCDVFYLLLIPSFIRTKKIEYENTSMY